MTSSAITDIWNPLIAVFLVDLRLTMFMAFVTGVISERVGMAGGAARGLTPMVEGEAMRLIEGRWTPGAGAVA